MAIPIIHSNQPPHSIDLQPRSCADFDLGKIAGEGSYSTVLNAIEKSTGMHYAIKVLDKKQILKEKKQKYVGIEKRVFQMSALHPLIIQLYYTFQDTHSLYFCLELASNGNLLEFCDSCCSSSSRSSRSVGGGGGGGNSMSGTRSDTRSSGTTLTSGLSIDIVRFFGAEISVALQYLHSKGVLHRDLKPEVN